MYRHCPLAYSMLNGDVVWHVNVMNRKTKFGSGNEVFINQTIRR